MKEKDENYQLLMAKNMHELAIKVENGMQPSEFFDEIMIYTAASIAVMAEHSGEIDLPRRAGDAICAIALEMMEMGLKKGKKHK